jgi:thiol:disulfide interchange protein DsbA
MLKTLLAAVSLTFAVHAGAAPTGDLVEGRDFKVLNPAQPTESPKDKIEVTEFFWYGCSHCFEFEPLVQSWKKTLPKDVVFRRVPALFPGGRWAVETKAYYAMEAMGILDKLHQELFNAIHVARMRIGENTLFAFMEKKGVDRQKFIDTYNSFAVQGKVQRSQQMSTAHGLSGVPAMVVNGKYMPGNSATTLGEVLAQVDKLIVKARAEQGGAKK